MIEELRELLRGIAENPARAIAPLWTLFWLWSIARSWIRRFKEAREARRQPAAPTPAPPRAPPEPARAARTAAVPARDREAPRALQARWPALIERAEALRSRLVFERSLRWLEPILASEVIAPLHAAHATSRTAGESAAEQRARGAVLTLQALEQVVRERSGADGAAALYELDRIAQAVHRPLSEYARAEGITLWGHAPLAVHFDARDELYARGLTSELLFVSVPERFGAHLNDYTASLQALGRRWFFAFPGLGAKLRDELGLSDRVRLVDPRLGFDERSAYAAFGPWLPALFAELMLTMRLGNAYVTALRDQVMASGAAAARTSAHGEYLSAEPPPLLRWHTALFALEHLGRHDDAKRHRAVLEEALPDTAQTLLPLADGRQIALPTAFMLRLTEQLAQAVLEARLDALGGVPLGEWPGLGQSVEDAREQVRLSHELAHGVPRNVDAARLLGAAWLAAEHSADSGSALVRLRQALSPRAEPATQPARAPAARKRRSLRAALADPRTLRRAIELGSAFSPPPALRR
jgi:hypothetical protein